MIIKRDLLTGPVGLALLVVIRLAERNIQYMVKLLAYNSISILVSPLMIREDARDETALEGLAGVHLAGRKGQFPHQTLIAHNLRQPLQSAHICCQSCTGK